MLPSDIILSNCKKFGWDQDKLVARLARLFDAKKATHIQKNNTLVVVLDIGNNSCEFHVYSADNPFKFMSSLESIILQLKATSIKAFYGKPNPQVVMRALELIKDKTGIQINPSDKPNYSFKVTRI